MHQALKWHVTILGLSAICAGSAFAGGFEALQFSPRSAGRGGAVTAFPDEVTALFYNPAGLVVRRGTSLTLGMNLYLVDQEFSEPKIEGGFTTPLTAAAEGTADFSYNAGFKSDFGTQNWSFAFAAYNPYKAYAFWGNESFAAANETDFRYLGTEMEFEAYYLSVGAAFRPTEKLAIGASVSMVPARYQFRAMVDMSEHVLRHPDGTATGQTRREGEAARASKLKLDYFTPGSFTGNIGIWYNPVSWLNLGASFSPRVSLPMDGVAQIRAPRSGPAQPYENLDPVAGLTTPQELHNYYFFNNDDSKLNLFLPQKIRFGAQFNLKVNSYFAVDITHTSWSGLEDTNFDDPNFAKNLFNYKGPSFAGWEDSFTAAVAYHFVFRSGTEARFAYTFDESAIPNEYLELNLIDAHKHILSIGASVNVGKTGVVDFALSHAFYDERKVKTTNYLDRASSRNTNESGKGTMRNSFDYVGVTYTHFFGDRPKNILMINADAATLPEEGEVKEDKSSGDESGGDGGETPAEE